jgi:hypothetical protein
MPSLFAPLPYNQVVNGFQFKKEMPVETHMIIQNSTTFASRLIKDDGATVVPNPMTFSTWQILSTTNRVHFSNAPDGCMAVLDGTENYVWGGDEYRVASFAVYDDEGSTFWYDFTAQVNNTLKDADNVAPLSGANSGISMANTLLLLHLDSNITDSSPFNRTVTATGITYDTSDKVFVASAVFDGSTSYLSFLSSYADLSDGLWTIDFRFKCAALPGVGNIMPIFYQSDTHYIYQVIYTNSTISMSVGQVLRDYDTPKNTATVLYVTTETYSGGLYSGAMYMEVPNNDWVNGNFDYYSGGTWYTMSGTRSITVVNNETDTDRMEIYIDHFGAIVLVLTKANYGFGSQDSELILTTADAAITTGVWTYIEVIENNDNFYIFTGAANSGSTTLKASGTSGARPKAYTDNTLIGKHGAVFSSMRIDEFRISNVARHTAISTVPTIAYAATTQDKLYVSLGSTRPIQGINFYILSPNRTSATAKVEYWDGANWVSALNQTDGTSILGVTLNIDGAITFDSTVPTCKQRFVHGEVGYFYKITFDSIDVSTVLYYVTVDAPFQPIVDIWDGTPRNCLEFFVYQTNYADFTPFISKPNYVAGDTTTFAEVGGLTSSQYIYLGFAQRIMGLQFAIPDPTYINDNAATLTVEYWNGSTWVTVGTLDDTTLDAGATKSFNHTGTITWTPLEAGLEYKKQIANNDEYYYYRLTFSNTISTDVRVDWCTGIPSPDVIYNYKVPLLWMDRLWMFNNVEQGKNIGIFSSSDSVSVWNGSDSGAIFFGDDSEIVAAETMFSRFGGTLYDNAILFKRHAIFMIDGLSPQEWATKIYCVSDSIGCVAPFTLQKCDIAYDVTTGITKHVLMFQSTRGIEIFDGNAVLPISEDIKCFFDPSDSRYINTAMLDKFSGVYDDKYFEYHWLFCTGTDTVINKEMVYDLRKKKWYEIQRGTRKQLISGWQVTDLLGYKYVYGGTSDGYIERLEYGTTFDGNSIVSTFRTGDMSLSQTLSYMTDLRHVALMAVSKNTTQNKVILNTYLDGSNTADKSHSVSQGSSNRIYMARRSLNACAVLQSFECIATTNNEAIGFEPLMLSVLMRIDREHISATQK